MSGATYTRGATCTCALLLCASYLDGALHLHVCACMRINVPTVHVLSRRRFAPLVNAVTLMAFKFLLHDFEE